ncbi:MAG TPA: tRNA uridine-5-carboxymethylaminomethyl(34) synthesis GTPase MnmE [Gemmatimonadota bacterium]|nr:tRNA uridine-5-carboxymethylaminomethyl(34) synthesis GTPase MnmE [Gemmatimonadota bacterium]
MTAAGPDTIAAVATAPGRAAVAVLRLSGPRAGAIAAALTTETSERGAPESPAPLAPRRATLRRLVHPETGAALDRAVLTWFPGPDSYTGEDVLEISCHGGAVVPALLLDAVCAAGARPAERGEFTRRAYLNGKLDLVQAEATLDLVDARSVRMGRAALFALERGLSRRLEELRSLAIELQALIAYDIDFPDEDDGPVERERVARATRELEARIEALLRHAPEGEMLREGALTVIAGRPNAGKSSLFNALLGVERAIVTEEPGTTRDAIEALLSVDGYPFRLVDTAGLRREAERIEEMGIEVARAYLDRADLALVCVESGRAADPDERAFVEELDRRFGAERVLVVRTKADLPPEAPEDTSVFVRPDGGERRAEVEVSAREGDGLEALRQAMLSAAYAGLAGQEEQPLVTRRRHARALERARASMEAFRHAWNAGHPPEIAVTHLQDAVLDLEELLGVVTNEDVLDALFSTFCVGK